MVSQEVIDWIKTQKAAGYKDEQLRTSLLQKGHSPKDVNDAFMQIKREQILGPPKQTTAPTQPKPQVATTQKPATAQKAQAQTTQPKSAMTDNLTPAKNEPQQAKKEEPKQEAKSSEPKKKEPKKVKKEKIESDGEGKKKSYTPIIIVGIVLILLVGAGAYYYFNIYLGDTTSRLSIGAGSSNTESQSESGCASLPDKLENCEEFRCSVFHPVTGEPIVKEVQGYDENGNCKYKEEVTANTSMTCLYPEDFRTQIAKYYREKGGQEGSSEVVSIPIYTVNGKDVEDPIQEALDEEICNIN